MVWIFCQLCLFSPIWNGHTLPSKSWNEQFLPSLPFLVEFKNFAILSIIASVIGIKHGKNDTGVSLQLLLFSPLRPISCEFTYYLSLPYLMVRMAKYIRTNVLFFAVIDHFHRIFPMIAENIGCSCRNVNDGGDAQNISEIWRLLH